MCVLQLQNHSTESKISSSPYIRASCLRAAPLLAIEVIAAPAVAAHLLAVVVVVAGVSVAVYLSWHKADRLLDFSAGGWASDSGKVGLLRLDLEVLGDGVFGGLLLVDDLAVLVVRHDHSAGEECLISVSGGVFLQGLEDILNRFGCSSNLLQNKSAFNN